MKRRKRRERGKGYGRASVRENLEDSRERSSNLYSGERRSSIVLGI